MSAPDAFKFSETHEWVKLDGEIATIGISDHAQAELGDVALTLLPEVGRMLQRGDKLGEIESIKAVSDLFAPMSGEVIAVNDTLVDAPEQINDDPYGKGWMVRVKITHPEEADLLLDGAAYESSQN